jgi:hypothetical protein
MKKNSKILRLILTTLVILVSQVTLFAKSNDYSSSDSGSGLSAVQIAGAVGLLLIAIVLPLVRGSRKEASHK